LTISYPLHTLARAFLCLRYIVALYVGCTPSFSRFCLDEV
jgi:hypothetical protein